MKTSFKFLIFNVFILLAFIFSSCEQTTEPTENKMADKNANIALNKATPERPFKGNILYTITSMDDTHWFLSGTGNLTHLGKCTTIETIYFADGYGEDFFNAADGSQIHLIWIPINNNQYDFAWNIVGGTGRFEEATGSGFCPPIDFKPDGTLGVEFIGIIKY